MSTPANQIKTRKIVKEGRKEKTSDNNIDKDFNSSILAKISDRNNSSIEDCIEKYGDAVWMISRKFSGSAEEAEKLTCKIFSELWENIENFDCNKTSDDHFILLIAMKCAKKSSKNLH